MLPCKFSYIILFPSNAAAPDSFSARQMLKYADPFVISFLLPDHGGLHPASHKSDMGMTSF